MKVCLCPSDVAYIISIRTVIFFFFDVMEPLHRNAFNRSQTTIIKEGRVLCRVEPGHPSWDVGPLTNCATPLQAIRTMSWFVRVQ